MALFKHPKCFSKVADIFSVMNSSNDWSVREENCTLLAGFKQLRPELILKGFRALSPHGKHTASLPCRT